MNTANQALAARWWSKFAALPLKHAAVAALVAVSKIRLVAPQEMLVTEGEKDGTVFLIAAGMFGTVRYTANGHDVWYADLKPGELTGELAALADAPRNSNVIAKVASIVFAVEREAFLAVANRHAEVAMAIARMLARRLRATSNHLADVIALPVSSRLHGELAAMGTQVRGDTEAFEIKPPPKIQLVADRIRASRETTSRAIKDLEARGFLKRSKAMWSIIVPADTQPS